jgi:hypothetical protein
MPEAAPDGTNDGLPGGEWRAQLPADLKENETFTSYKTLGDFAKAHIETVGKVKDLDGKTAKVTELEGRLSNSIPKLSEKATDEEKTAYYKAIGRPDKAEEYEMPKPEGGEADPKMVSWSQQTFHKANLTKEQASVIGAEWNTLIAEMAKAETESRAKARADAEDALKKELGGEEKYKEAVSLAGRVWKKLSNTEFDAFLNDTKIGNDARMIRFIINVAKLTGEDTSPPGAHDRDGANKKTGLVYDKTPTQ